MKKPEEILAPADFPGLPVHTLVERWAREAPGALAVESEDLRLTYGELNRRANRLAHRLRRLGAGPEVVVALRLERSPGLVVAALAALKAGAAYLPVDPAHPAERLAFMLRDSGARLLLTARPLSGLPAEVLALDGLDLSGESEEDPGTPGFGLDQLAYLIYTSGSTGTPKGIELGHRGLASLVAHDHRTLGRTAADRCTLTAGPGFDASVWETWSALTAGSSLHVPPAELVVSPPALLAWMADRAITVAFLPTPLAEAALAEPMPAGLALRVLTTGGDRLTRRPPPGLAFDLWNIYGPAESTVAASMGPVPSTGEGPPLPPDIGWPVANTRVHILDEGLEPVAPGETGELCVAGLGLARGYRGQPGMTAERFVPDPSGEPGSRLYRTGDLARWPAGGEIECLGRIDFQVKIRGFRIELGEIQAVLDRHPAVRESMVLVREGESRLCAYVVPRGEREPGLREGLRSFLAESLPEYMIPTAWVFLEALPLTLNGKVDRRALALVEPELEGEAAAPRTPLEEVLAGLFAEVLGTDRTVGVHDSFFDLGGQSLLAARLAMRVREISGVDLGLRGVFEHPTVAGLAGRIGAAARERQPEAPPLVPVPRGGGLPLSFAQRRLWFLERLQPGTALYNLPFAYDLRGELEVPALAAALDGVVRRHEALRAVFVPGDGEPAQAAVDLIFSLPEVDLGGLPDEARRAEAERLTAEEARRPYDLERGPLLRAALLRLGSREHRLLLGMHHIVSDGWSVGVLMEEVSALYRAVPLAPLAIQYPDFAVWQRRWLAGGVLDEQLAWWRERLAGAPALLELAGDRPRPPAPSFRGAVERLPLGDEAALLGIGRQIGATLFMTLLAAFQALLHRYTGQDDLVVGSPAAGRDRPELEPLIGFFVNMLPLRADLSGEPGFLALLAGAREMALGAFAHQDLPFEKLIEELAPERNLAAAPLFQAVLALQDAPTGPDLGPGIVAAASQVETGTAKFDLTLFVEGGPGGLEAIAEYATDLFDGETVRRLLGHFRVLLEGVVADPGARVSELPLLTREERQQITVAPILEVPDEPVHVLFERWADRTPEALAIVHGDERLTYAELDRRANRLAHRLRRLGVGPESVVAILLERSADLVVAALGTLKAGGAWLPIDPAHPAERVLYILRDSGAAVLLTDAELPGAPLPPDRILLCRVRCAHQDSPRCAQRTLLDEESSERPAPPATDPDLLAYVIYTSGSTGAPKGTELRHGGLSSLVAWHLRTYGLGPGDRSPLLAGPGFDASVWEMWPPLAAGAAILVPPREVVLSPPALLGWFAERQITVAFLPTPLAEAVLAEPMPDGLVLRTLLTGGDRLHRRPAPGLPFEFVNHYGPTESTVVATAGIVKATGSKPPDIGSEIANTRVHLLDRGLRPVPLGVPGELCLAGEGLARGYRGRPDLTAERFVPAPDGLRIYRTGDLARRLPDGRLEFLGRIDQQVKIRGFRIELGEIESALAALPGVAVAAALVREDRLTAYLVAPTIETEDLRAALARRLPEPMIPTAWVLLDEMPLTPNGKVDRRALERIAPPEPETPAATLQSPLEELVAGLFSEALGIKGTVGPDDDFFHLGGHSLLAVQLVSRARQAFGVDLDVRAVFERPTVAGLAGRIEAAVRGGGSAPPPLLPEPRSEESPLSFAQQRLWFLDRLDGGTALYNVPVVFRIRGAGLNVPVLAGALDEVVRRHEALRSVFREAADGEPAQIVQPFVPRGLPVIDLTGLPEAEAGRIESEIAELPFDLARGPLLRALLLRLGAEEHHLMVSTHHIASDGWSVGVLAREISSVYQDHPLPPLPIQYADYAVWQRRWLAGPVLAAELAGWRERLAGLPAALELPTDRPRPAVQSFRGTVRRAAVDPEVGAGLAALSRRQGATFFMTAMVAFQALLHRWTGQEDFAVGTPVAGRGQRETEGLIGFFVNTLALRASLAGDPGFGELLARVRAAALDVYAHPDLPFEQLVAELAPERDLSRTPIFQVLMSLQEAPPRGLELGPGFSAPLAEVRTATSKFDLSLELCREGDGLTASVEYATDLFDAATAGRFLGHLRTLLAGIVATPEAPLSELPLMTEEERRQLAAWDTEGQPVHPEGGLLHGLFEAQAARTPEAPALVWNGEILTYAELEARSARLARRLRRLGVGPEISVGICLPRTPGLVVALMAVLRAGGFYVPLDPVYPAERLAYLLEDSGCGLVLTDRTVEEALPPTSARLLRLDDPSEEDNDAEPSTVLPGNLAYLIYTSGSTGRPKAVAIEHHSAVLLAHWAREVFSREDFAGMLASTSITFDMSVFEIFVTLAWGGTLILVDNALALATLGELPPGIEVRLLDTVPSAAAELLRMDGLPASVRTINLGGEAVPRSLADRLYQRPETERVFNLYGPSEDTTFSTISWIERDSDRVLVGRPVDGTRAWVLDRGLRLAPIGVPGELYLAGGGLSRGYLGRPELTAERFLPDPFGGPGERMYRTGDLVRRRPDGELDYLGRLDHQVKIRGFRVEIGEVEAALAACPGVGEAVVMAREDTPGDLRLAAYLVASGELPGPGELRRLLRRTLPEFMVPSAFVPLPAFPRTPNGKIDRRALPVPAGERREEGDSFLAPRTPIERQIADIWREVLGIDLIGVRDNFWDLGGHSLLATKVLARVNGEFGLNLPLQSLFLAPTLGELTEAVGQVFLTACDGNVLAELDALSEEEIRALLDEEEVLEPGL